ncbi:DUF3592 domain-containing protein [Streptomyces niveus]|uniref:DUF3592 domain-containing protein n=1 Tax=Streptomyces niveus TaxID=193462 RepID=UPI003713FABD
MVVVTAFAALLVFIGYGFVRTGLDGLNDASAVDARGRSVDGTVLAKEEVTGPQGSRFERIEVRFTTEAGVSHQFWEGGDAEVGDTIRVHYEPGRPETAGTHSVASDRAGYGLLIVLGLALMVLMPLLLLRAVHGFAIDVVRTAAFRPVSCQGLRIVMNMRHFSGRHSENAGRPE